MSRLENPRLRIVIYEGTGSRPLSETDRFLLFKSLLEKGYAVTRSSGNGEVSAGDGSPLLVLGCFDDQSLSGRKKEANGGVPVLFRDVGGLEPDRVLEVVEEAREGLQLEPPGGWKPWFPVIDYSRCTNCMQCLSFCLFDVYGVSSEQKIQVQTPDNCKTDCPACSRVCPEVAILFPKYKSGPINGDEVSPEDLEREKMKIDISSLLGGDIYATLRARSERAQSRFARERDEERALKERKRCLAKLQAQGDIPAEVLASLPSQDEILRKAERAAAGVRTKGQES